MNLQRGDQRRRDEQKQEEKGGFSGLPEGGGCTRSGIKYEKTRQSKKKKRKLGEEKRGRKVLHGGSYAGGGQHLGNTHKQHLVAQSVQKKKTITMFQADC